jgi:protein-L-isoaspartate(D-aspartate) O-methyltransferase
MVIPVGEPYRLQQLVLVTKAADGSLRSRQLLPVRFVPLTGRR